MSGFTDICHVCGYSTDGLSHETACGHSADEATCAQCHAVKSGAGLRVTAIERGGTPRLPLLHFRANVALHSNN